MVSSAYNLRILPPPHRAEVQHSEDFTRYAQQYKQSIRASGGFWQASWVFSTDGGGDAKKSVDTTFLLRWYDEALMYVMQNKVGGLVAWDGFVAEMELSMNGLTERRSVLDMSNTVRVKYTDENGDEQQTDWYINDLSVSRFGRKEEVIDLSEITTEEAEAYAQAYLRENGWPHSRPTKIDLSGSDISALTVTAVGRVGTANFKYTDAGDGVTVGNADESVRLIIENDTQFLTPNALRVNDLQILQKPKDNAQRAYDRIQEIEGMGRVTGDTHEIWRFAVWEDGRANYVPFDNEPIYKWLANGRLVSPSMGEIDAWLMRPGVVRNHGRVGQEMPPGSLLQRTNDIYIAEIEVSAGAEYPTLKPEVESESDLFRAIEDYQRWLEQDKGNSGGSSGGASGGGRERPPSIGGLN